MKKSIYILSFLSLFFIDGFTSKNETDYEKEIRNVEKAFEKMAAEKGIAEAFHFYAAEDAIIKRENDSLIKGREAIRKHFASQDLKNTTVTWDADYVSTSKGGDMAWTYGKYVWKTGGSDAKTYKGVFHTVWKRQADGEWKYVWD